MKETIRMLREEHNFSQTYLASALGVSRQMYIKYETGEVEPPVRVISGLCKLYSVSYDLIIDDKLSSKNNNNYSFNEKSFNIASPTPSYGTKNNDDLSKLFAQITSLPQKFIPSVSAFILLLQQEEKKSSLRTSVNKSKKAFFDLAGKISLDAEDITAFREESKI